MSFESGSFSRWLVGCVVVFSFVGCNGSSGVSAQSSTQETESKAVGNVQETETKPQTETPATGSGSTETKPAGSETKPEAATEEGFEVSVAEGAITFNAPGSWENVKPRFNMIEAEIKIPKTEGEAADAKDGRLTIMGAMGTPEANIQRWYGQYSQPDGSATADAAKVTKTKVKGNDVTWVDITGTLLDRPGGPMAGGKLVKRENYRTLGVIVQTGDLGQYFIKLYGPGKTIGENEEAFKSFIESITIEAEAQGL